MMKLTAQQIIRITELASFFADARTKAACFKAKGHSNLDMINDLLADEKVCYNELVSYLKEM